MKTDIHEYGEEMTVKIEQLDPEDGELYKNVQTARSTDGYMRSSYVITALNEAGHNSTRVDLLDVLSFVKNNMPDVWKDIK